MGKGIRRAGAIVGSAAFAGAMVLGVGAGTAGAQTVGTGTAQGIKFTRSLDKASVKYGDTVTISSSWERIRYLNQVQWIDDNHPTCFKYVDGSLSNSEGSSGDSLSDTPGHTKITSGLLNYWKPSFTVSATYKVLCDPSTTPLATGGLTFSSVAVTLFPQEFTDAGPSITVEKASSSVTLGTIGTAQTGVSKPLNITTSGIPNGQNVEINDGSTKIGDAAVNNNQATYQWTPSTSGSHTLKATFAGTTQVAASASQSQTVNVSQSVQPSTTTLDAVTGAKVGQQSQLKATVSPAAANSTVTFKVDNVVVGEAPVVDGVATYGWSPSSAGNKTVTAEYSGGGTIAGSVSDAQSVSVAEADPNIAETTTTVDLPATAKVGTAVTLGATVANGTEGATVTFKSGNTVIGTGTVGSDGKASVQWTPGAAGLVTITAEYAGDATTSASSGSANLTVDPEATDPGDPGDPGDPSTPGTGSLGRLGSLGSLTGSLGN